MAFTIGLCALSALPAWFAGWLYVLRYKYHKIRCFLSVGTILQKNKLLSAGLYLLLGALAGVMFSLYGWTATKIIRYLLLMYGTMLIAYLDAQDHVIPNAVLFPLWLARAVLLVVELILHWDSAALVLASAMGGMLIGLAIFLIAYVLSKKSIGMGDVKLIAVTGFYTGTSTLYGILILSLLCCLFVSLLQMARHKLTMKDFVAFGPFVALGTVLALLLGL